MEDFTILPEENSKDYQIRIMVRIHCFIFGSPSRIPCIYCMLTVIKLINFKVGRLSNVLLYYQILKNIIILVKDN